MDMYTSKSQAGCQAAFASKLGSYSKSVYTSKRQAGCQAAIASKLGSYSKSVYTCESQAGCKAAFASNRASTGCSHRGQARLLLTTSKTSLDSSPEARMRSSSPFINAWRATSYLRQRVNGANCREAICG